MQRSATHARAAFEEVRAGDPSFGDIERELRALEASAAARGEVEASGEAYESFDDLLSDGPTATPAARYESFDDLFSEESNEAQHETSLEPVEPDTAEAEPDARSEAEPEAAAEAAAAEPTSTTATAARRKISFVGGTVEHLSTFD
jgi:hypothetical protein